IDAADAQQLSLGIGLNGNKGFEGLAYDAEGKRLFVAKERDPVRIYEIHGFPHTLADKPFAVHVVDDPGRDKRLFVRDLSSLQFDEGTGHLLALSDESRLVVELDTDGEPVSTLSL
ncbi:SdiA-regulated domain-containing protein, partial [Enterobacter cloacae]|uniref:SdiA-regulated domain-containing protein n=1 Tax=Enterobacter cloacae TaxID=550 RepID=UPI00190AFD40